MYVSLTINFREGFKDQTGEFFAISGIFGLNTRIKRVDLVLDQHADSAAVMRTSAGQGNNGEYHKCDRYQQEFKTPVYCLHIIFRIGTVLSFAIFFMAYSDLCIARST